MGDYEDWVQQPASGLLPNGLLPDDAATVVRSIDLDRWSIAEQRTAELIKCIKPNKPSEELRCAVASYVRRLIMNCFPCQVFTFGSVPLKTYLPDGDIDLTAFSNDDMKETWPHQVRDTLEKEEKNENAEFRVKEVQYIQAEVKIIKCLVENIVVDISFNQLGGLCTLCFLEEVDNLISQDHLFKRSIILIKAWCYYESRVLGAHHGLISTYALETLVLYIFHVFNKSFHGPLEVLYRFLEFFSKFDWDNFCISLWGPVPISSLPDVTADPPRKDGGELLLSKPFLDACSAVYAVYPTGQENQGQPFVSKYFNVIDPLRVNNNLGRSVSKGNFFRIRSAFAFGAKRLARLLDCPKEDICVEISQFFLNTWDRHGNGQRPDAPRSDLLLSRSSSVCLINEFEKQFLNSAVTLPKINDSPIESVSRSNDAMLHESNQKNISDSKTDQARKDTGLLNQKGFKSVKPEDSTVDGGRCVFGRTRSSPELTDNSVDVSFQGRRDKISDSGKVTSSSARSNSSQRKSADRENLSSHSSRSSTEDHMSARHSFHNLSVGPDNDEYRSSLGTQEIHHGEQDLATSLSTGRGLSGQVNTSCLIPQSFPPVLGSMGGNQRNLGSMSPNIPFMDTHWGANLQFSQGVISPQIANYFSAMDLNSNPGDCVDQGFISSEVSIGECEHDVWHEQSGRFKASGFDNVNGILDVQQPDDEKQFASSSYNTGRLPSNVSTRDRKNLKVEELHDAYEDDKDTDTAFDVKGSSGRPSSMGSWSNVKSVANNVWSSSSDNSLDGSSSKIPRVAREKKGKKSNFAFGGKSSEVESTSNETDSDDRNWNLQQIFIQRGSGIVSVNGASGSESLIPFAPMFLEHSSRQKSTDNSGSVPLTFYPTGPPVPFVTMLPFYNFPSEARCTDASTNQFCAEGLDVSDSVHSFISSVGNDQPEISSKPQAFETPFVDSVPQKADILNSDFASHWQNLQYGRFCQNSKSVIYQSPVMVPSFYLQGRYPLEAPGRPASTNLNVFSQIMSYEPRIFPVVPFQTFSNLPAAVPKTYFDDMPRHRTGTGTYLPNPKVSYRERHANNRKGNYYYDRNDHHGNREGNWNNGKSRSSNRSHSRNQSERSSYRHDRASVNDNRPWRHDMFTTYQSQTVPMSSQTSSTNAAYGMYPVSSNGFTAPPVVMYYPYEHSATAEQLEFGTFGSLGYSNPNKSSLLREKNQAGAFDLQCNGSLEEQPSSPRTER